MRVCIEGKVYDSKTTNIVIAMSDRELTQIDYISKKGEGEFSYYGSFVPDTNSRDAGKLFKRAQKLMGEPGGD